MLSEIIIFLQEIIVSFGWVGLFSAAIVEEVVAPIPSLVIMMFAGFFFIQGPMSADTLQTLLLSVVLPISTGITLGSLLIFYIAYFFGKPAIEKFGKWFGIYWSDIEIIRERFSKSYNDELLVFLARAVPVVPSSAISAFCGLVRMNIWKYLIFTFLGTVVRSLILSTAGWQAGNLYFNYAVLAERFGTVAIIIIFTAFIIYKIRRKVVKNNLKV